MEQPKDTPAPVGAPAPPPMYAPGHTMGPVVYQVPPPPQPMTIGQVLSPTELKKIRKMTWINFALTMLQLACCIAFILVTDNYLETTVVWGSGSQYQCFIGTYNNPSPCKYAYTLASVSIFWGFILSLIQCLTLDCCGMGRFFELMFDIFATIWWMAGAITLSSYISQADAAGVPQAAARHTILGLAWVSAAMFLGLAITNIVLIKRYGKALKSMKQQMVAQQQQAAAAAPQGGYWVPAGHHVVQMGTPGQPGVYAPAGYPGAWPAPAPGAAGVPPGYPAAAPAGYPGAAPAAAPPAAPPAAAAAPAAQQDYVYKV